MTAMPLMSHAPDFSAPASRPWSADQDETLCCVQVRQETHDVKTFVLAANGPRSFRYLPGQFITLELDIDGRRINRCYTLSSTPTRPDLVSITVKRVPGGVVSNWLHDHLHVGMALGAMGPSGAFTCFADGTAQSQAYLFVSGGSGVTPLMSMTRALHDLGSDADIVFLHCARTPADLLFAEELTMMARNMPRLRLAMVCEHHLPGSPYAGHLGRMDAHRLAHIAPDFLQRDVYTCGPAPFMAAVCGLLVAAGFDLQRYREESFSFESLPVDSASAPVNAQTTDESVAKTHRIQLQKMAGTFDCREDQTILQAAIAAGFRLPSSCSSGACGTCKTRKVSGQIEMKHAGGIRQREIDQGWMLPCCSRPTSDIVLDR
ncbi:MAG: Oxidoreductase FAD-binding domain protein [Rhodoferax sp.]|nr:Oxidoreductase FAD-binding domain protein [Rhodoferax sp.]